MRTQQRRHAAAKNGIRSRDQRIDTRATPIRVPILKQLVSVETLQLSHTHPLDAALSHDWRDSIDSTLEHFIIKYLHYAHCDLNTLYECNKFQLVFTESKDLVGTFIPKSVFIFVTFCGVFWHAYFSGGYSSLLVGSVKKFSLCHMAI